MRINFENIFVRQKALSDAQRKNVKGKGVGAVALGHRLTNNLVPLFPVVINSKYGRAA